MGYNILILNWQDIKHPLGGGAEVHLQEIYKRIADMGHNVSMLCCSDSTLPSEEIIDGIKIIRRGSRNFYNYGVSKQIKKMVGKDKPDIIVDCLNKVPILSPRFVKDIPIMGIVHHLFKKAIFKEVLLPMALYVYAFEQMIKSTYKNTPFCVISESTKTDLMESGISEDQIQIVDICVDHDLYKMTGIPKSETPLIGYLGRIKKYKSVDHLIRAFSIVKKKITDAKLIIVGDGDNLEDLKNLSKELGLDESINFAGFVSEQEKVDILQQCHVVVNPSVKEGWGLTVIEANACGTPTVAANVPGLRDSVIDGETGLLYEYGNIEQCAEYIEKLLSDEKYLQTMNKNAVEWAGKFDWDKAAENTLDLMKNVIKNFKKT